MNSTTGTPASEKIGRRCCRACCADHRVGGPRRGGAGGGRWRERRRRRCAGPRRGPRRSAAAFHSGRQAFQIGLASWASSASHSDCAAAPGRDLEHVAVAVVVVGHHVQHVDAPKRLRERSPAAAGQPQLERALDQALAEVAGAEAVGRETPRR